MTDNSLNDRQQQVVRFALSFLMANLDDAFADFDEESDNPLNPVPTMNEIDEIVKHFLGDT